MSKEYDPQVIGIIDESEPEEPDEAPADYTRGDAEPPESSDQPEADAASEDTPSDDDAVEAEGSADEEPKGEPADDQAADTRAAGEDGTAEKFMFAGREWDSKEDAEQSVKSWEGRIRVAEDKVSDYENRLNDYYQYVEKVSAENEQLRQAQVESKAPDSKAPSTEDKPGIDMAKILRVAKLAEERGIDPVEAALKLYHTQSEQVWNQRLEEMKAELSAPYEEMRQTQEVRQAERAMFDWAQSATDESGAPKYPLLKDDVVDRGFVENVWEAWQALGKKFGAEYAFSELGFDQAYQLADRYRAQNGTPVAAKPETGKPKRDPASGRFMNNDAKAASDLTGETPDLTRPKESATKKALRELGNIKEVSIDGGESLGFFE